MPPVCIFFQEHHLGHFARLLLSLHSCAIWFSLFVPSHSSGSSAAEAGHLMGTMMSDVTRAIKELPCVSVAAIDGCHHLPKQTSSQLFSSLVLFPSHVCITHQVPQSAAALSSPAPATCAACRPQPPSGILQQSCKDCCDDQREQVHTDRARSDAWLGWSTGAGRGKAVLRVMTLQRVQ